MMPIGEGTGVLEDRAFDLIQRASMLAGQVHPLVREAIGDLVRSMNCYYSNLIEGHQTHPRDIDRALKKDFAVESEKRNLQLEAVAHIHVQRLVDIGEDPQDAVTTTEYIQWLHREFCERLPPELLVVVNPDTGAKVTVQPGQLRTDAVQVGLHRPPAPKALPAFLARFQEAYNPAILSKPRQVIAVAAAHHRLLWIHPFVDGNGRLARLLSHAWLKRLGVGNSLWSVARGLARGVSTYKSMLMAADAARYNGYDGRGALSHEALVKFCDFFLTVCVDQVEYMGKLLDVENFSQRLYRFVQEEAGAGRLHPQSFPLLREALLTGQIERGSVQSLVGLGERQARNIVAQLTENGLLLSESSRAPLRLGFPASAVEWWFPSLYPPAV